jgi:hypothetical protein
VKLQASNASILNSFDVAIPRGVAFDGKNVWVSSQGGLYQFRPSDGTLLGTSTDVGTANWMMTFDGSNLWIPAGRRVYKVRTSDRTLVETFDIAGTPWGIAFDGVNIWIVNRDTDSVSKFWGPDYLPIALKNPPEIVHAFGNPGIGKTHLLYAIGQELIARGRRMYFTTSALLTNFNLKR